MQNQPWSFNTRRTLITGADRSPIEFSLLRQLTPSFRAGLEYMPRDGRVAPLWNWRLLEATDHRPALVLGQGTAWPSGKVTGAAYSLTVAQAFSDGWSAYVSASYAPDNQLWQMPAGVQRRLSKEWSTKMMWDGSKLHPFLTYHGEQVNISLLLLDGKIPTLGLSVLF